MATIKDGGPAFPVPQMADCNGRRGMSLRDWFAGQAVQAIDWRRWFKECGDGIFLSDRWAEELATAAYILADKMMAERELPPFAERGTDAQKT